MLQTLRLAVVCLAVLVVTGGQGQAASIHPLGQQTPDGGWFVNSPATWSRGWRFTAKVADIYVTELGLNTPVVGQGFQLDLWDVATQTSLASVDAVSTGNWHFESIAPIHLQQGSDYIVSVFSENDNSYWYKNGLAASWYPTGNIEYVTMQYHNDVGNPFPYIKLSGFQYGLSDIGYQIGSPLAVPEPTSLALFGIGVFVAGVRVARRQRVEK